MKYAILIVAILLTFSCSSKERKKTHCFNEINTGFLNSSTILKRDRTRVDILNDIYYAIDCEEVEKGLQLSDLLISKGGFYGHYYRYRFTKLKDKTVSKESLSYLQKAAELGYSRAKYELYEISSDYGEVEKANKWLFDAAKQYNRKALSTILSDNLYAKLLSKADYNHFAVSYWFLVIPEEIDNEGIRKNISRVINELSKSEFHLIISDILNKYRFQIQEREIIGELPFKPWDY